MVMVEKLEVVVVMAEVVEVVVVMMTKSSSCESRPERERERSRRCVSHRDGGILMGNRLIRPTTTRRINEEPLPSSTITL